MATIHAITHGAPCQLSAQVRKEDQGRRILRFLQAGMMVPVTTAGLLPG